MPSYDYRCGDCRQGFTVERSMKDESKQHCVACGSANANRVWTVFATIANGSTMDYGQGTWGTKSGTCGTSATDSSAASIEGTKSACGTCISRACGACTI